MSVRIIIESIVLSPTNKYYLPDITSPFVKSQPHIFTMSDWEEDERPSFGGLGSGSAGLGAGSGLGRRKFDDDSEQTPDRKKMKFNHGNSTPAPKTAGSFAAKMMAKMGYVQGQGLGADGQGRLNPIDTQLRPQGAGLGAVKEKTKQAIEEEKRAAAFRGEVVEDSEEEEKKRRKERKKKQSLGGSGVSTPRSKVKYKTARQIEEESAGLQVPDVLKSIIDLSGKEVKLPASGILTPNKVTMIPSETEEAKLARRARRELETLADEWNTLQDLKKAKAAEDSQLIGEIDEEAEDISNLERIIRAVEELELSKDQGEWEAMTRQLEDIETEFKDDIDKFGLREIAVAAIHPLFRAAMLEWEPLENPTYLLSYLERLQHILGVDSEADERALALNDDYPVRQSRKSTTPYETLIYTLWLPAVRTAITNKWDVQDSAPLITLFSSWRPLLPSFVLSNLVDQLLLPRLIAAVSSWKPRRGKKDHGDPPHVWLFPWLSYLPSHHLDPESPSGLITDVRRKLRSLVSSHDVAAGPPNYLSPWESVLGSHLSKLLVSHLLPRLARYLSSHFEVDPSNQVLDPLTTVLSYSSILSPTVMAQLLDAEFFPKFHNVLRQWLSSTPNYEEVIQWYSWWKEQIPVNLHDIPPLPEQWAKALEMMNLAADLGDEATEDHFSEFFAETILSINGPSSADPKVEVSSVPPVDQEDVSFRDIVEQWAEDNDLLLLPRREAHPTIDTPLFSLVNNVESRGGVVVYLKDDVLWERDRKDKSVWKAMDLEDPALLERANR